MERTAKHTVTVFGRTHEVTVSRKSEAIWEAVGRPVADAADPNGSGAEIRVTARTESAALKEWIASASYWET